MGDRLGDVPDLTRQQESIAPTADDAAKAPALRDSMVVSTLCPTLPHCNIELHRSGRLVNLRYGRVNKKPTEPVPRSA
jgi:hypothetical protein